MITPDEFKVLLPLACAWAEQQERLILDRGLPLTPEQTADARSIGVAHPDLVRLMGVRTIPAPEDRALRAAAETTDLISPRTVGLTLRYGIYVRTDCWGDRRCLVHELVHTCQYERLGGIEPFLHKYLLECILLGYPAAPLEKEAVTTAARVCA